MHIYEVTVPLTNPNNLNGIISKLKKSFGNEETLLSYVTTSAIRDNVGQSKELVTWEFFRYQAGPGYANNLPWIQLSFPGGSIYPTAYSMRGNTNSRCFCTNWNVYGINEGDESNELKWDLLGENNVEESIYCRIIDNEKLCNDSNIGTFILKSKPSPKGYRHLRWRCFNGFSSKCSSEYYFPSSGIDIYGKHDFVSSLSLALRKKNECTSLYKGSNYHLLTNLFVYFMISLLKKS